MLGKSMVEFLFTRGMTNSGMSCMTFMMLITGFLITIYIKIGMTLGVSFRLNIRVLSHGKWISIFTAMTKGFLFKAPCFLTGLRLVNSTVGVSPGPLRMSIGHRVMAM